ncbi:MAG: DUF368 domain-containing protein [Planctomycetes bacterium]|nr:DUF368 domain-containing protein [Planctomycetota bacterium]
MTDLPAASPTESCQTPAAPKRSAEWSEFPGLFARGVSMGIAEVIPGVSGGTLALITGIYTRLVDAIRSADLTVLRALLSLKFKEGLARIHWRFLFMVFAGQLGGIVLCTRIIKLPELIKTDPAPVLGLFFGLVVGSIFLLARDSGMPGFKGLVAYLIGGGIGYWVVTGVPAATPMASWFLFLCGMLAISAWILPGISGSYTLLLLKKYDTIWGALAHPSVDGIVQILLPFGLGAAVGITLFSRLLSWILHHYEKITTMAMNGLLIASLYAIFPFQNPVYEMHGSKEKLVSTTPHLPSEAELHSVSGILACVLPFVGLTAVLVIDKLARKKQPPAPPAAV